MDEIIDRCKTGNVNAQEILYEKYSSKVYKTAFLLCKSRELAEDITQETFIRIFSKLYTFKGNENTFSSWLYSVTLNVAKNTFRKQRWLNFFSPIENHEDLESLSRIDEDYEKKEREELLFNAINMLPYKLKEIIILKYYNDFSQEEISNILNIPIGTVKSRINSSLKKIKKFIGENNLLEGVLGHE